MNFKRLLLFLAAPLALVMGSCTPEGPEYTIPSITITDAEGKEVTAIGFAAENPENAALPQEYVVTIKSTRSWSITKEADWLGVTPADFSNTTQLEQTQEVKFTAVANEEGPRSQTVKVTMDKITKEIVVSQAGAGQTALGDVLFYDDFDKKVAEKDGTYWPYMSAEYGNPTPENQSGVTYASKNVTVRANSNSDGSFSDYAGSGSNNIFFGKTPTYLTISGISLAELDGNALTMTFGTEKYSQENGSTFTESEFHVYLSADGEKWTEIDYTFAGTADGRWNLATAQFNLKEVPESVSIAFIVDVASSYRLDDLKLTEGGGGVEIDLAQGSELDLESGSGNTGGGDQGGETPAPENALLWASFATDMANFTTENVELGGLDYVWYHDAQYKQMKASAYKDDVRYVTESYLVSPVVALTGAEDYYMNFEHTGKYFGNMSEQATLWVREEGGAWAQLTIPTYMTGDNWTFVNSGDIALTAYAGKNIQIGFRYTSTATDAPTWEVKNVLVAKGTASETPDTPDTPNVPLESIDATSDAAFVCSTDDSANAAYGLGESTANGASATGFKLGKGKQEGKFTSAAVGVSGDKYLNFFAVSWGAGGDKTIYFRVNGGEVKSQAIRANDGAKGNAPYTMSVYANDHYSVLLSGLKETDVIEFGTNADFALTGGYAGSGNDYAPRVIFFGVKLTDEPVSGESGEGGGNTEPEDPEDPETPVEPTVATIASILALGQDATVAEGTFVEGVVISNSELNNLTSKKGLYIQDETAGLQFYCGANHSFKFGDKVKVDLSGQKIGAYNGAVQISGTALDKFTVLSSDNAVEAKAVTMADFLANKYEGQYIALEGVQVVADDLAKTWGDETQKSHISINMEDAEGNNFVVFSSRYATYAAETVAQGSGTIKGISSINVKDGVTTMQIIFAQATDYAGLTGERFGATVEPEEPEIPVEPETLEALDANAYYVFKQATEFVPGKWYAMVAENNAATALTSNYGYLKVVTPIELTEGISLPASCAWGIVSTEGGYTIQQYDGKYVYQTGSYNSFNVDATAPASGHVWTIKNGVITNAATSKTVQFDTQYNSYGCYDSVKGAYPAFYELVEVDTNAHLLGTSVSSLSYTADGGEKTFDVTTYREATLAATSAAEWLTVSVADGVVTVVAAANEGEARDAEVTVTFGEESMTVAVEQAAPLAEGEAAWVLVTDAAALAAGDQIVIVATDYDKALGTTQNNNNRASAAITKSGNTVVIDNTVQVITLEAGTVDNTFGFNVGTGYLYAASGSSNHLKTGTLNDNASWLVTIDGSGVATIKAQGDKARNWMRYNSQNDLFSCYASGQADIAIYKYTE